MVDYVGIVMGKVKLKMKVSLVCFLLVLIVVEFVWELVVLFKLELERYKNNSNSVPSGRLPFLTHTLDGSFNHFAISTRRPESQKGSNMTYTRFLRSTVL